MLQVVDIDYEGGQKCPHSIVSMMANDDQVIEVARATTAVILTGFRQNIPVSASSG